MSLMTITTQCREQSQQAGHDFMMAFCANKLPPMTAAYTRSNQHKSAKEYSHGSLFQSLNETAMTDINILTTDIKDRHNDSSTTSQMAYLLNIFLVWTLLEQLLCVAETY